MPRYIGTLSGIYGSILRIFNKKIASRSMKIEEAATLRQMMAEEAAHSVGQSIYRGLCKDPSSVFISTCAFLIVMISIFKRNYLY